MEKRFFHLLAFGCWLAAMSWLVVVKVAPTLVEGDPPDYQSALAHARQSPAPVCWRMRLNVQPVGFAATRILPGPGGTAEMHSVVRFEKLPLTDVLEEVFGGFAQFFQPMFDGRRVELDMLVLSYMRYSAAGDLQRFETIIDLGGMRGFLRMRGEVLSAARLRIETDLNGGAGPSRLDMLTREIDLPPNALVNDALSPRTELKNLHVGQAWTMPVYRPFPPNSPVRLIHAKVERHELVYWEGSPVETFLVEYREDAGGRISADRDVIGRAWVKSDGNILQQEVLLSDMRFVMEKLPSSSWQDREKLLDDKRFAEMSAARIDSSSAPASDP